MKFKINQEVRELKSGKKCVVIATKKERGTKTHDHTDNIEVFPENFKDYLIAEKISEKELGDKSSVDEHELFAL